MIAPLVPKVLVPRSLAWNLPFSARYLRYIAAPLLVPPRGRSLDGCLTGLVTLTSTHMYGYHISSTYTHVTGSVDGKGTVICRNGHERLRANPEGKQYPWHKLPAAAPHLQYVGFNLIEHTHPDVLRPSSRDRRPTPAIHAIVSKQSGPTVGSPIGFFCSPIGSPVDSALKALEVTQASGRVQNCRGSKRTKSVQWPVPGSGPTTDTTMAGST